MTQRVFALLLAVAAFVSLAHAADPQPYRVEIASAGNSEIDEALKATSDLLALRKTAPVSPFGLIARARSDIDRLKTALESFGYYQSSVTVQINGMLASNPALGDALGALPKGKDAQVAISFTLGPLYHIGRIDIDGELPDRVPRSLGLATGQPAVAATILAAGAGIQNTLQERAYAFAEVAPPVAYEAADAPVLDLRFHVVVGPKVNIGRIRIEGLRRVHESLLRGRLALRTGAPYSPSAIERARHDILGLGVFSQVSLQIGTAVDDSGGVPVTFKVRERLRHAVTVNAAYSSDLGGSGGVTWTDRNVFGNAEQLTVAASVINLGGSDTTGVGYDTSVKYLMPDFGRRDQSLQFAVGALKQSLQAYEQTARTTSVTLARKLSSLWSASIGVATTNEQIVIPATKMNGVSQAAPTQNYTLFALPLNVAFDSTRLTSPLDDPRRGFRASLTVAPTYSLGRPSSTFIISQMKLASYFDLNHLLPTDPGRTVLASRFLVGRAQGAGETSLPPDQRFYAGGSGTVRGYAYQSVGPKYPATSADAGLPIGGTAIEAGSLELRQRFGTGLGAAIFVDAGQVSTSLASISNELRFGAGVGIRYYTPIGPIRFDVAVPTNHLASDRLTPGYAAFEIYIGLGQAF